MELRRHVPWWGKIALKIALSRLPIDYRTWYRIGIFKHGNMQNPKHAIQVFEEHWRRATQIRPLAPGFVAMELGPGDSLLSGVVATAFGASRTYLVDSGPYAESDVAPYHLLARALRDRAMPVPQIEGLGSVAEILTACHIDYLTEGAASLSKIPDKSVDFAWSQVVLEHIRKDELGAMCQELHRVMRPTGIVSHAIDLRDHLGGGLNHLRFSEKVWESKLMASSGFYTNRLRMREMLDVFRSVGFDPHVLRTEKWPTLPTPRKRLAAPFRDMRDDELAVSEFDVLLEVK